MQVDDHCSGVGPVPTGLFRGVQLADEFLGSPEVVVVDEGEPISARLGAPRLRAAAIP